MAPRTIDSDLLWRAIVWVQYRYANLTLEEQTARRQRPYRPHDGKVLAFLIQDIRSRYHAAMCEQRAQADFLECKDEAFSYWRTTRPDWTEPEANFYSSVVSTYFAWTKHGTPDEAGTPFDPILSFATHTLRAEHNTQPPLR